MSSPPTAVLFPIVYFLIPYTALIQNPTRQFTVLMLLLLIKGFAVIVGFPCITILLTNAAPSVRILGTLNGFATTFSGLGRAVGPASAGATFSWGVQRGYVLPAWWLLGIIAVGQAVPAWMIIEGEGPSGGNESDEEDEEALLMEEEEEEDGMVAATTTGPPNALIAKTGRKGGSNDEDLEEAGFSPLARMSSRASGPGPNGNGNGNGAGYGTMNGGGGNSNEGARQRV